MSSSFQPNSPVKSLDAIVLESQSDAEESDAKRDVTPGFSVDERLEAIILSGTDEPILVIPLKSPWLAPFRWINSTYQFLVGVLTLMIGLAALASTPLLQLLSLGYMLEVSGRIARTGRIRDGFIGIKLAARIGTMFTGTAILFIPLWFVSSLYKSAELVSAGSNQARNLRVLLFVLTILIGSQVIWAWCRGGKLRHFFWPAPLRFLRSLRTPHKFANARDATWNFLGKLRIPYYLSLGTKGLIGTMSWLFLPIFLLVISLQLQNDFGVLLGIIGGVSFIFTLLHLPYLQTQFAATGELKAFYKIREARKRFSIAPLASSFALILTLLLALPLYLAKVELTESEVAIFIGILFVASMFPARLAQGWAVARANRREEPKAEWFAWGVRFATLPLMAFYVLIVLFTPIFAWHGYYSLFEQHAFLFPIPFF